MERQEKSKKVQKKDKLKSFQSFRLSMSGKKDPDPHQNRDNISIYQLTHSTNIPILKYSLLLATSLIFAACLMNTFHELGHALVCLFLMIHDLSIHIHVFGLSYVTINDEVSSNEQLLLSFMGAFFDIFCASLVFYLLWKKHNPKHFLLLMWAPFSYIVEGRIIIEQAIDYQTTNLPNGDIGKILHYSRISPLIPLVIGIFLLFFGFILFCLLLRLLQVPPTATFYKKGAIIVPGVVFFSTLNLFYVNFLEHDLPVDIGMPLNFKDVIISLTLTLILSLVLIVIYRPLYPFFDKLMVTTPPPTNQINIEKSLILAISVLPFQLIIDGSVLLNFIIVLFVYISFIAFIQFSQVRRS
ncbi:MAG: hypothetical protein ACXAB7_11075 [Candidatus Kariarchaeaceae archaeon]